MENISVTKNNKILSFSKWMALEVTIVSGIIQAQKDKFCYDLTHYEKTKNVES